MLYRNTNPAFGDEGPFEAESKTALADEPSIVEMFAFWAAEAWDVVGHKGMLAKGEFLDYEMGIIRRRFIGALEEVE